MYYTYEGDSLVLVNDPPDAVYVPRDANGDGNIRYYILDSAGRMVGSTLTPPPSGTRVAPASAMGENGQIDVSQIPPIAGKSVVTSQIADIQNSLAQGGIYNSPDGKYSIIGGGDANTPGLPSAFAGKPRILISGGGSANGVVPPEIASAFSMAPQGEQQHFAQQKAVYEAGEGVAPTFMDAVLAAGSAYVGGSGMLSNLFGGGMLGNALSGATISTVNGGNPIAGAAGGAAAGALFGGNPAGTGGGYDLGGDLGSSPRGGGTFTRDISGGLDAPGGFTPNAPEIATSYPVSTPPTTQDLNATDITNSVPPQGYSNLAGETGTFDPTTPQPMPETPNMGNSMIDPSELPAGNPPVQLTNEAGQALTGGAVAATAATGAAASASGVGATQAAGAGLTAAQILSGASTAVGAGSLLGSFMDSVSSNPIMKALQAGQGIAGIVSGLTSTQGMISPQDARAMADPFASSRQQYINQLNALMANPSLTTSTPGYQFNLQQGLAGIEAKQAKSGVSRTGAGDIAVQQYGQQQAMSSFDQQVKNLSGLSGAGVNPAQGATAALTAQGQQVDQRNAGWKAIGQGIGGVGQSLARGVGATQPGVGATQPGGYSITNPNADIDYEKRYDPYSPSMQPMGGYVADPTIGAQGDGFWDGYSGQTAPPQNYWGI